MPIESEQFAMTARLHPMESEKMRWVALRREAAMKIADFLKDGRQLQVEFHEYTSRKCDPFNPLVPPYTELKLVMKLSSPQALYDVPSAPDAPDYRPPHMIPEDHHTA